MAIKSTIDDEKTFEALGYRSGDLGAKSALHVVTICAGCGTPRATPKRHADTPCRKCSGIGKPSPMEGKKHTEETRRKMRDNHADVSGENNPSFGKTVSGETRIKQSITKTGENNPFYGKSHTIESRDKMSEAVSRRQFTEETLHKMSVAKLGKHLPIETCERMSVSRTGDKNHNFGKPMTQATKDKLSEAHTRLPISFESRKKHSATLQGIEYDDWEEFAKDQPYCPKFNEVCRESNREKYDRRCFVCGKPEPENVLSSGKHLKLSVHHVDMNKIQGCNGHAWKLVPTCRTHHGSAAHTPTWMARIQYLLIGYGTYFFFVLYLQMRNIQNELGTNVNGAV